MGARPTEVSKMSSAFLMPPNQLWHLSALLGDEVVSEALTLDGGTLTNGTILNLLTRSPLPFYTDSTERYLVMGTNELVERDLGLLKPIATDKVLFQFGLAKMEEANERGYSRL